MIFNQNLGFINPNVYFKNSFVGNVSVCDRCRQILEILFVRYLGAYFSPAYKFLSFLNKIVFCIACSKYLMLVTDMKNCVLASFGCKKSDKPGFFNGCTTAECITVLYER